MPSVWKKLCVICIFVILSKQGDSQNVRLKDGKASSRGRLEVKYNGEWGTVCNKKFNQSAATVVCKELGFPSANELSLSFQIPGGPTGGRIWLDIVLCSGNESSLFDCDHNDWGDISASCSHEDDVRIDCSSNQGVVALSEDVKSQNDFVVGKIVVLYNTDFGYIHNDSWDYDDVKVVCRQLGYYTGGNYSICSACDPTPCNGSHSYSWDVSIDCDGDEERLLDCANASSWKPYRDECTDPFVAASVSCAVPKQGGWSEWTHSSSPCIDGIQKFTRSCSRPAPEFGGEDCVGISTCVAFCGSPSHGDDSNEKHQQVWKLVLLAAGPAAVVGLIAILTILIMNRRKLKHLCYRGVQLPPDGESEQERKRLINFSESSSGGPDGGGY